MRRNLFARIVPFVLVWLAALSCRTTIVTIGPIVPLLLVRLHLTAFWAGSLTALPLFIISIVSLPAGRLADRLGHRVTLLFALALLALAAFMPILTGHEAGLFIDVSFTGVAVGLAQPTLAKLARSMNPLNPTLPTALYANALVMGGFVASLMTTSVILPLVGSLSWRGVLGFWGAIALITAIGWLVLSHPIPEDVSTKMPQSANHQATIGQGFVPIAVAFAAQGAVFYALVTWLPDYYVRLGWTLSEAACPLAIVSLGSAAEASLPRGF